MRREVPDEHGPPQSVSRSGVAQILDQSAANIRRKRKPLVTIALAAHADRARAPVDVVEPELSYLVTPQAEADQQGQDRQIADANDRAGIAGRKKAPHLIGIETLGQPCQSATQDSRHGRDKRPFRDAVQMQKAEERTQRRDCQLRHPAVQARAPRHHEGGDIGRGQALQFKTIGRQPVVQKRAQAIDQPEPWTNRPSRSVDPATSRSGRPAASDASRLCRARIPADANPPRVLSKGP